MRLIEWVILGIATVVVATILAQSVVSDVVAPAMEQITQILVQ